MSLLKKTKKILQDKGWCKGSLWDSETGAHCLLGAIGIASGLANDELYLKGMTQIFYDIPVEDRIALINCINPLPIKTADYKMADYHEIPSNIWGFNDSTSTTEEDIHRVLDCAIEKENAPA